MRTTTSRTPASAPCRLFVLLCAVCLAPCPPAAIPWRSVPGAEAFSPPPRREGRPCASVQTRPLPAAQNENDDERGGTETGASLSTYSDSDGASKGIVGSLTGLVNRVSAASSSSSSSSGAAGENERASKASGDAPPASPGELVDRIRRDYEEKNYLWTGDLDLGCFREDCLFADPTISFVGKDKFVENTQNLVPIVEAVAEDYRSDLLSISLGSQRRDGKECSYVETRWNMVGSLTASPCLFWKPGIDVIGRTRFWFESDENAGRGGGESGKTESETALRVYFYDESWEVPAWKALLQILTPAGTFPSTSSSSSSSGGWNALDSER
ncbi:unnamed protein product [Pseudo-nitzschia multistriata]|uniref:SnoaL-like domain-containing protein n=1 Tax=Pseudo-nitzschia multistriata TaxID=183589 RepID=A0A448Z115_9STRA|nr:unnamed protein product [Pseudo-nitzschia multistriata]